MKTGDRVYVTQPIERKADNSWGKAYYSGEGIIKDMRQWDMSEVMIAVYFQTKGTVWFECKDVAPIVDFPLSLHY